VLASPEKIDEVSDYFNRRINATDKSNLHGEKGAREMEADVVRSFEKLLQDYATRQLLDGLPEMRQTAGEKRETRISTVTVRRDEVSRSSRGQVCDSVEPFA
jgi:hypothetical protein